MSRVILTHFYVELPAYSIEFLSFVEDVLSFGLQLSLRLCRISAGIHWPRQPLDSGLNGVLRRLRSRSLGRGRPVLRLLVLRLPRPGGLGSCLGTTGNAFAGSTSFISRTSMLPAGRAVRRPLAARTAGGSA